MTAIDAGPEYTLKKYLKQPCGKISDSSRLQARDSASTEGNVSWDVRSSRVRAVKWRASLYMNFLKSSSCRRESAPGANVMALTLGKRVCNGGDTPFITPILLAVICAE